MKGQLATILGFLIVIAGFIQRGYPADANDAQARVAALSAALAKGAIGRVEIVQIPGQVLTRARISPEMLERQYHNKLIIRDITDTTYRQKIVESFNSISAEPRKDSADLRWGVIFFSRDGSRMGAVYFDKSGDVGSVDDFPASFKGNFFRWLDSTFSACFQ